MFWYSGCICCFSLGGKSLVSFLRLLKSLLCLLRILTPGPIELGGVHLSSVAKGMSDTSVLFKAKYMGLC